MVALLGVGVPDDGGGWLLHRVSLRLATGETCGIVSSRPEEAQALLDSVTARHIATEGRVWIRGVPVMRDTIRRVRSLVSDVPLGRPLAERRSVLWNTLAGPGRAGALGGLLRLPRRGTRNAAARALAAVGLRERLRSLVVELDAGERARLALAQALVAGPAALVVRNLDEALPAGELASVLGLIRTLARTARLCALVSLTSLPHAVATDRIVVIADGALIFDGPRALLRDGSALTRLGLVVAVGG